MEKTTYTIYRIADSTCSNITEMVFAKVRISVWRGPDKNWRAGHDRGRKHPIGFEDLHLDIIERTLEYYMTIVGQARPEIYENAAPYQLWCEIWKAKQKEVQSKEKPGG